MYLPSILKTRLEKNIVRGMPVWKLNIVTLLNDNIQKLVFLKDIISYTFKPSCIRIFKLKEVKNGMVIKFCFLSNQFNFIFIFLIKVSSLNERCSFFSEPYLWFNFEDVMHSKLLLGFCTSTKCREKSEQSFISLPFSKRFKIASFV